MREYYSLGEVARMLEVKFYRITYAHATDKVPEPRRIANKRAYRSTEIKNLAKFFNIEDVEQRLVNSD